MNARRGWLVVRVGVSVNDLVTVGRRSYGFQGVVDELMVLRRRRSDERGEERAADGVGAGVDASQSGGELVALGDLAQSALEQAGASE